MKKVIFSRMCVFYNIFLKTEEDFFLYFDPLIDLSLRPLFLVEWLCVDLRWKDTFENEDKTKIIIQISLPIRGFFCNKPFYYYTLIWLRYRM